MTSRVIELGQSVVREEAQALLRVAEGLSESFETAVRALADCRGRVCVTGIGKAGIIGHKVQATLSSVGTPAYFLHPSEALHGDLGMVVAEDVVLGFSKSGSGEITTLFQRLKSRGNLLILVTANTESAAARSADCVIALDVDSEVCPLGLAPTTSTTAMAAVGDALAIALMSEQKLAPEEYARNHPGGRLGRSLTPVAAVMRTGADCPLVRENEPLRSCFEKLLAAPHRAGAVLVVDAEGRLLGIATQGDLARFFMRGGVVEALIGAVMTRNPKTLLAGDSLTTAEAMMERFLIDDLPVVDEENRVLGILDVQDLIGFNFDAHSR